MAQVEPDPARPRLAHGRIDAPFGIDDRKLAREHVRVRDKAAPPRPALVLPAGCIGVHVDVEQPRSDQEAGNIDAVPRFCRVDRVGGAENPAIGDGDFRDAVLMVGRIEDVASLELHRIAHREFLQSLRSQKPLTSLEEIGELPAPLTAPWTDAVELRALLRELPLQEREVVALHDLEGYTAAEIAAMMDAPATTVNYRLRQARNRLRRERGERAGSYSPIPSMIL